MSLKKKWVPDMTDLTPSCSISSKTEGSESAQIA